ncbi:hypothetical protein EON63_22105 [archaeon]|nr:MAG: hypothetical protein EON63_22105 [archaeon]
MCSLHHTSTPSPDTIHHLYHSKFIFQHTPYYMSSSPLLRNCDNVCLHVGDFNYIEFIANSKSGKFMHMHIHKPKMYTHTSCTYTHIGQFFFYSHDGKYMIKTQTKDECNLLKSIFPVYIQHLTQYPDSMLVKFYGLHRVYMPSLKRRVYFCVMSSVFDTPLPIHVKVRT